MRLPILALAATLAAFPAEADDRGPAIGTHLDTGPLRGVPDHPRSAMPRDRIAASGTVVGDPSSGADAVRPI